MFEVHRFTNRESINYVSYGLLISEVVMPKRYREPVAKDGELKACWGKLRFDTPDLCFAWGDGVNRCDSHLLNNALTSERHHPFDNTWSPSLYNELESRGYDMTTLKFSIQKKQP